MLILLLIIGLIGFGSCFGCFNGGLCYFYGVMNHLGDGSC